MDEVKITSKIMRSVISKLISNLLKKKTGYDIKVQVNKISMFEIADKEDKTHAHIDLDAEMTKDQFESLMKQIGLA